MKEIPPEILAAFAEDTAISGPCTQMPEDIGLNQFEDLVLQKIRDFSNYYGNQFCDVWPDAYPDFMSAEDWMGLFKAYLLSEEKYEAIRMWIIARKKV